jgi:Zn-finger nucleic acid-binding protein
MNYPRCNSELVEIGKHGVVIDNCTSCGGIWLDSGELEAVAKLEKSGIDKLFLYLKSKKA